MCSFSALQREDGGTDGKRARKAKKGKGGIELGPPKKVLILYDALDHLTKEMVAFPSQKKKTNPIWFGKKKPLDRANFFHASRPNL